MTLSDFELMQEMALPAPAIIKKLMRELATQINKPVEQFEEFAATLIENEFDTLERIAELKF